MYNTLISPHHPDWITPAPPGGVVKSGWLAIACWNYTYLSELTPPPLATLRLNSSPDPLSRRGDVDGRGGQASESASFLRLKSFLTFNFLVSTPKFPPGWSSSRAAACATDMSRADSAGAVTRGAMHWLWFMSHSYSDSTLLPMLAQPTLIRGEQVAGITIYSNDDITPHYTNAVHPWLWL